MTALINSIRDAEPNVFLFEYGHEIFAWQKNRALFPVLGANFFYKDTDHPYAQAHAVIERNGIRIGVIGVMGQDAVSAIIPSFIAPMQTDAESDPRLQRDIDADISLAGAVTGVDVLFAGHADAGTPEPVIHPDTGTIIMQTYGRATHLGYLQLELDPETRSIANHQGG